MRTVKTFIFIGLVYFGVEFKASVLIMTHSFKTIRQNWINKKAKQICIGDPKYTKRSWQAILIEDLFIQW